MMRRSLFLSSLFLAVGTSAATAQTIVNGGGTVLQAAIDFAEPGDTLIVQGGDSYPATVVDKGITIVMDSSVSLLGVTIEDVPAGEMAFWSGGVISEITIRDCAGIVGMENVLSAGETVIDACAQVSLLNGSLGPITSNESRLSMVRINSGGLLAPLGGGLSVTGGRLSVAASQFRGRLPFGGPAIPTPAMTLELCDAFVTTSTLETGLGGLPSSAITAMNCNLRIDSNVTLEPDGGQPPIAATGSVVTSQDIPSVTSNSIIAGQSFDAVYLGEAGELFALALGPVSTPLASPTQDWWLGGGTLLVLATGILDGNFGTVSTSVPTGFPVGEIYGLQIVTLDASGGLAISPAIVTATR